MKPRKARAFCSITCASKTFLMLLDPCAQGSAPANARDYRGIIVLGSNHCANEQLRWIENERCLLQSALQHDVPVLGHCFGAQCWPRHGCARLAQPLPQYRLE